MLAPTIVSLLYTLNEAFFIVVVNQNRVLMLVPMILTMWVRRSTSALKDHECCIVMRVQSFPPMQNLSDASMIIH